VEVHKLIVGSHPDGERGRSLDVLGIAGHTNAPATQCRSAHARFFAGQRRYPELVADGAVLGLTQGVGISPVAHEGGVARLPDGAGVLFLEVQHFGWHDVADPACDLVEDLNRGRIVDLDDALRAEDTASAVGHLPFQRVAGQALISLALEDEAPERSVALGALAILDGLGGSR